MMGTGAAALGRLLAPSLKTASSAINQESRRTVVRHHWKYPKEYKRFRKHSWYYKIRTRGGREEMMQRIIEGKVAWAQP